MFLSILFRRWFGPIEVDWSFGQNRNNWLFFETEPRKCPLLKMLANEQFKPKCTRYISAGVGNLVKVLWYTFLMPLQLVISLVTLVKTVKICAGNPGFWIPFQLRGLFTGACVWLLFQSILYWLSVSRAFVQKCHKIPPSVPGHQDHSWIVLLHT